MWPAFVALRNLERNARRTLAVLLTVALGVGSLFLFHGFNTGIMNQYRENTIRARYGHGQLNTKGYRSRAHSEPWKHWIRDWRALTSELLSDARIEATFPRVEFSALLRAGDASVSGRGQGIDGLAESRFFTTLNLEQGVPLSAQDDGLLLGRGLAHALNIAPGDRVTVSANSIGGPLKAMDLLVVGVFHTGANDFDNTIFRVPLEKALELLDTNSVESIALGLHSISDWEDVARSIAARHPELEVVPFATLDKLYYQHSVDWLDSQFAVIQLIILVIVVLGIFNTVSTGILERKSEIGNLRANGESSLDILVLIGCEGAALGILGSITGCALAVLLDFTVLRDGILMPPAPGITRQFHVLIELQPSMAMKASLMGIAATLAGTVVAGWRVSRMPIGAALRAN